MTENMQCNTYSVYHDVLTDYSKSRNFCLVFNVLGQNGSHLSGITNFRSHSKSRPFSTQPLSNHLKSRLFRISDPHRTFGHSSPDLFNYYSETENRLIFPEMSSPTGKGSGHVVKEVFPAFPKNRSHPVAASQHFRTRNQRRIQVCDRVTIFYKPGNSYENKYRFSMVQWCSNMVRIFKKTKMWQALTYLEYT